MLLLCSGLYLGMCTWNKDASPSSSSFQKATLLHSGCHQRKRQIKKGLGSKELKINLVCHQVYPQYIYTPPLW